MPYINKTKKTKSRLQNSLILLLQKINFENITIADISNQAKVNRATFYRYYHDKYEILEEIQQEFFSEITPIHTQEIQHADSIEQLIQVREKSLRALLSIIQKHRFLLKGLLNSDSQTQFVERLRNFLSVDIEELKSLQSHTSLDKQYEVELLQIYSSHSLTGTISYWIRNDSIPLETVVDFIIKMSPEILYNTTIK